MFKKCASDRCKQKMIPELDMEAIGADAGRSPFASRRQKEVTKPLMALGTDEVFVIRRAKVRLFFAGFQRQKVQWSEHWRSAQKYCTVEALYRALFALESSVRASNHPVEILVYRDGKFQRALVVTFN